MALYAFDGTGNKDNDDIGKDTNVVKFYETYQNNYEQTGQPGKCFYVSGVGTRWSFLGMFFGSIFGLGGRKRLKEAYKQCEENFVKGDQIIDIIGFSRGAALAIEFANKIKDDGIKRDKNVPVRFLGIWDTVASFGFPGNKVNLGHKLTLPSNLGRCCHAIALDERRSTFPLTRVSKNATTDRAKCDVHELWFRGYHSDVGGGNKNHKRSHLSLTWMMHQGKATQLPLFDRDISNFAADSDIYSACKKPKMDNVANKVRVVQSTDVVHDSVQWVERAGSFLANNPPDGSLMIDNSGESLVAGFSRPQNQENANSRLA
ncbi:MAG: hypothetical protein ACI8P9_000130 [Parasphingorhabdus sp.]|jgi:uncharacterized protein (DUF2235 family)